MTHPHQPDDDTLEQDHALGEDMARTIIRGAQEQAGRLPRLVAALSNEPDPDPEPKPGPSLTDAIRGIRSGRVQCGGDPDQSEQTR